MVSGCAATARAVTSLVALSAPVPTDSLQDPCRCVSFTSLVILAYLSVVKTVCVYFAIFESSSNMV